MENQKLDRYVGDYDRFMEVYEDEKEPVRGGLQPPAGGDCEAPGFRCGNKARVATRNMAMSRQKKLDKMEVIELARGKPKPGSIS